GLAEKIVANADFTVFTATLRPTNKWQDGTAITAEDVVYSFRRAIDPAIGSKKANDYFLLKNAEAIYLSRTEAGATALPFEDLGVKALSEYVVEFTLQSPVEFFLDYLKNPGWAPIQKAAGEKYGELYGTESDKVVASGPFTLARWDHNASVTLVKNANYWDAANVKLDEVYINLISDANTQMSLYDTGMLDFVTISQDVANGGKYPNAQSLPQLRVSFIEFNPNPTIEGVEFNYFQNAKIREALSLTFDRRAYAAQILKQPEVAAYGMVPYGMRGENGGDFREQVGDVVFDMNNFTGGTFDGKTYAAGKDGAVSRAKDLLAQGLAELGKTKAEMERVAIVHCINSAGSITQAEAIQAMWKQYLDLNIKVVPLDIGVLLPMLMSTTFQCVVGGGRTAQTFDVDYMLNFVYTENKWLDPTFRSLYEKVLDASGNERIKLLKDVEKMVVDNFVYIPQVNAITNFVVADRVSGFKMYPLSVQFDYKYIQVK
ncbi:MAG: peptide ABC transporter substrate-binding protein, partial [Sphaerochaetaceae bacterium]|nr:peptide ABC transporter substrate-binding protein [Sphaerochaetaceae bacterium]